MQVVQHIQKTSVDDYYTDYKYKFNQKNKKLYLTIENSKTKKYKDTLDLAPYVHDLLSAAYYPRNINFNKAKINDKYPLPVILDTDFHNIYYKYLGKEQISTNNVKQLNCIKIAPLIVKTAIYSAGETMTVWLSNDKNKVPILMESDLRVGKISVQLMGYKGLRNSATY